MAEYETGENTVKRGRHKWQPWDYSSHRATHPMASRSCEHWQTRIEGNHDASLCYDFRSRQSGHSGPRSHIEYGSRGA